MSFQRCLRPEKISINFDMLQALKYNGSLVKEQPKPEYPEAYRAPVKDVNIAIPFRIEPDFSAMVIPSPDNGDPFTDISVHPFKVNTLLEGTITVVRLNDSGDEEDSVIITPAGPVYVTGVYDNGHYQPIVSSNPVTFYIKLESPADWVLHEVGLHMTVGGVEYEAVLDEDDTEDSKSHLFAKYATGFIDPVTDEEVTIFLPPEKKAFQGMEFVVSLPV